MSDETNRAAGLWVWFAAGTAGVLLFVCCLLAFAAWMASQRCSGSMAGPLAAAAAGIGSFFSGWLTAFCKQKRGLFCGTVQGMGFALLLAALMLLAGSVPETADLLRFAVVMLCGCIGGFAGVRTHPKKRFRA